jgi:hypothetical protein
MDFSVNIGEIVPFYTKIIDGDLERRDKEPMGISGKPIT